MTPPFSENDAAMRPSEFTADQSSPDLADQASATEALFLQQAKIRHALLAQQARMEPPDEDAQGNRFCLDCGDQIPSERIAIVPFAVRCVPCLSRKEQKRKLHDQIGGINTDD